MELKFITSLEIEECKKRIENAIDSRTFALLTRSNGLIGRVDSEKFRIQKRKM